MQKIEKKLNSARELKKKKGKWMLRFSFRR